MAEDISLDLFLVRPRADKNDIHIASHELKVFATSISMDMALAIYLYVFPLVSGIVDRDCRGNIGVVQTNMDMSSYKVIMD